MQFFPPTNYLKEKFDKNPSESMKIKPETHGIFVGNSYTVHKRMRVFSVSVHDSLCPPKRHFLRKDT